MRSPRPRTVRCNFQPPGTFQRYRTEERGDARRVLTDEGTTEAPEGGGRRGGCYTIGTLGPCYSDRGGYCDGT